MQERTVRENAASRPSEKCWKKMDYSHDVVERSSQEKAIARLHNFVSYRVEEDR